MDYETNKIISQEELNKMGEELSNYAESLINQQFKKISNDMDYEKKYKQLHKFISDLYPFMSEYCKEKVEGFFPELKESEDEKARKALVELVKCNERSGYTLLNNVSTSSMLAWLENIPYTIDHEKREGFHLGYKAGLEKQGEQKPWSEKDEKEYKYVLKFVDNILNNCGNKKDYEHCKRCYDWLKSLRQRIGG